jgi:hypothetical protein
MFSLSGDSWITLVFFMLSILIILFLVVIQAVAVKQRIGTFTRALTFPTCEYDDRNGDFPVGAVPL